MPRDGSNIYHRPVGTDAVTDTTIESTKYNSNVADVEQDLNLPRPIVAGGTGAANAHDAMIALSGEIASQVVTNYDTFPFVAGSFISTPGATSAPDSTNFFSGICYMQNSGAIILEARQHNAGLVGPLYVREKWSTWGVWKQQAGSTADLDAAYVNVAGDTMTGALTVNASGASVTLQNTVSTGSNGYKFINPAAVDIGGIYSDAPTGGVYVSAWGSPNALTIKASNAGVAISNGTASTSPTTGALTVAGGVGVGGNLYVGGTSSPLVSLYDPTGAGTSSIRFDTNAGQEYQIGNQTHAFFAYDNVNAKYFIRYNFVANTLQLTAAGAVGVTIPATTASTSSITGALTVAGGVGIGGTLNATLPSNFVDAANGKQISLTYDSGSNYLQSHKTDNSASSDLAITGQYAGLMNNLRLVANHVSVEGTTASTSPTTGALTVAGGIGVAGKTYTGDDMVVTRSGSPTTGYVLLGNGTKYIGFDGSKYLLPSASLFLNFTGAALTGYGAAMCINYTGSNSLYGIVLKPGADTTYACVFMNTGDSPVGTISQTPTTCAYNTSSDGRLKEDLKSFDAGNIVDDTNVYDFAWKSTGERTYGVIGQQAIEVYPTAVTHDKEHDWYGVDYSKYVPVLLQELKALRARVAQLEGAAARPA